MSSFVYDSLSQRVRFGVGALGEVGLDATELGFHRPLILTSNGRRSAAAEVLASLSERAVGIFDGVQRHVPVEIVAQAMALVTSRRADSTIAVGGGSAIGLSKAIALEAGLPIIAVPTTYAGSEMTPLFGVTEGGVKRTGRDLVVLPRSVVYDPSLTYSLPVGISVVSGFNGVAHAVEALYAKERNPLTDFMAEEAISRLVGSFEVIGTSPDDRDARESALLGAWLAGSCLGTLSMGLHHRLCHVLGGSFDLPHAEVHTAVLPHVMAFNAAAAPDAVRAISRALNAPADLAAGAVLFDRAVGFGARMDLRSFGLREVDLDRVAELVAASPVSNPRPFEKEDLLTLLGAAWRGDRPVG